jgi:hypothetical protein
LGQGGGIAHDHRSTLRRVQRIARIGQVLPERLQQQFQALVSKECQSVLPETPQSDGIYAEVKHGQTA